MLFLSLDCSRNDSRLAVFLTEGKRVLHVLILYLVRSGNGFASDRIPYGQASTYRPHPTYYVTVLVFMFLYVCTTLSLIWNIHFHKYRDYDKNLKIVKEKKTRQ